MRERGDKRGKRGKSREGREKKLGRVVSWRGLTVAVAESGRESVD